YTIPVEQQADLASLAYEPFQNLTLSDGDLMLSDRFPASGASITLTATLHNTGDSTIDGAMVSFYDGDPATGGTLIGSRTVPGSLAAHSSALLAITYQPPDQSTPRNIYAIADPLGDVAERSEADNQVSVAAFGPDLVLDESTITYLSGSSVRIQTRVQNQGTAPTSRTDLIYRDGTRTIAIGSIPPLNPGQRTAISTAWSYGALAQGTYQLTAWANEVGVDFAEVDRTNNTASVILTVLPDLLVGRDTLTIEPVGNGSYRVSATVSNASLLHTPATTAAIYLGDPTPESQRLATLNIVGLDPLGSVAISETIQATGPAVLYLVVNPTGTFNEMTNANNIASALIESQAMWVYLPLIHR
ncbi:MAG: hypothetical protein EOM24_32290, partial [Chloroflexia bacterium]|nr:hypothetical protein [Chloroflexia bacterium]